MDEAIGIIVAAILGGIVSLVVARWELKRFKLEQQKQLETDCEQKRIRYLDPLNIAAQDLLENINKLLIPEKKDFYIGLFSRVKELAEQKKDQKQRSDFALWCNGEGAAAVTTLYNTAVYFASVKKIRSEIPRIQLTPQSDFDLLKYLNRIRKAFGGEYGLWVELQDSLGDYVINPNGSIMNYKCFCCQLVDEWDYIWFLKLMDYYKNFHMKWDEQKNELINSLSELINFISGEIKSSDSTREVYKMKPQITNFPRMTGTHNKKIINR